MSAFFVLHRDLPREGPGEPSDIAWVATKASVKSGGRVLDAGCGPGADIPALLDEFAPADLLGLDWIDHFVAAASSRFADDARVTVSQGDMLQAEGPFDLIWCAGAIYFAGVTASLQAWRAALAPNGVVAFSAPAYFTDRPSEGARAFWDGEGDIPDLARLAAQINAAGYDIIAQRPLTAPAWEAYYQPMDARVAKLRDTADAELHKVLNQAEQEAALWRAHQAETGYQLCVVRPR